MIAFACWIQSYLYDHKSVKGRAVTEFLADHPVSDAEKESFMFPNEMPYTW